MGKKKYVAYGSNLNVCQMARRCPNATVFGIGKIRDYQLTFRGVATIVPEQGRVVPVGVWEIDEKDEKALDIYEGYPSFYRKETIPVEMANGETIDGMVYIMNSGIPLFKVADTPEKMLALGEEGLISYIRTIGLYKNKAKHVMGLSKKLIDDFNGQVPDDRDSLMTLPGVGRKTANVVLNVIFHKPTMPVDTHLLRVSPKIGLAEGNTPETVEKSLLERIPAEYLPNAHHWILLHGRYVCTARNPKCTECLISDLCKHNE